MAKYDVIVIGAGHNGLIAAAKLAKAGLKVIVLEKSSILGGCSKTEHDILPGCKISGGGVVIQRPILRLAEELELRKFGFEPIEAGQDEPITTYLFGDKVRFSAYRDIERTCSEIAQHSKEEADNYRNFVNEWAPLSQGLGEIYKWTNPNYTQLFNILEGMGRKVMWLYLSDISEILTTYFSSDWLAGLARVPWVVGVHPTYPGTGFTTQYLPHIHWAPYFIAKGGMGGFIEPLAKAVEHLGGEVRRNSGVSQIIVEKGIAKGVKLESGEEVFGKIVLSATHCKITYLKLVGEKNLEPEFYNYIRRLKEASSMFVLYLELSERFPIESRNFMILRGLEHVKEEATAVNENRRPPWPTLWLSNDCPYDPTLAPHGRQFISVMGVVPHKLQGTTWEAEKEKHAESILDALERRVPGIRSIVVNRNIHTPEYYEKNYNLYNASTYGLSCTLTQMWSMKPPFRAPIKNLYLTGMDVHPGPGINGLAGRNSSNVILGDIKEGKIKI